MMKDVAKCWTTSGQRNVGDLITESAMEQERVKFLLFFFLLLYIPVKILQTNFLSSKLFSNQARKRFFKQALNQKFILYLQAL